VSEALREKWDARYLATPTDRPAAAWVLDANAHLLPDSGVALDLACGRGGNALFLADRGLQVSAWDISPVAVADLDASARLGSLRIIAETRDAESLRGEAGRFDVIVVSRFLNRALASSVIAALRPAGLLFYQTFTVAKTTDAGPRTTEYLLAENELLRLFAPLSVRFYREDARCGNPSSGLRDEAYFVGQKLN
jgi:tellurite methyltransferase